MNSRAWRATVHGVRDLARTHIQKNKPLFDAPMPPCLTSPTPVPVAFWTGGTLSLHKLDIYRFSPSLCSQETVPSSMPGMCQFLEGVFTSHALPGTHHRGLFSLLHLLLEKTYEIISSQGVSDGGFPSLPTLGK